MGDLDRADGFVDLPMRWRRLLSLDDTTLTTAMVLPPERKLRHPELGTRAGRNPLPDHLVMLERDHVGRPMATLCHAALIVLIRRERGLEEALTRYFALWDSHADLLLAGLSLRWLVSAADTFADHGRTKAERMAGVAATMFVTTIKLYETERHYLMDIPFSEEIRDDTIKPFDLDGIVPFQQRGDAIANMIKRKDRVVQDLGASGRILSCVIGRASELDTVYSRMRDIHTGKGHKW
jgi:hypothetical protein